MLLTECDALDSHIGPQANSGELRAMLESKNVEILIPGSGFIQGLVIRF